MFGHGASKAFDVLRPVDATQDLEEDTLFSPHIIYTYGTRNTIATSDAADLYTDGFVNEPHCDNDENIWASGIFAALDARNGQLLDDHDTTRYHFYNASYGVLLDIASCNGVVNVAWRGKLDIHGTTTGSFGNNTTRYAATSQLNKRMDAAAVRCMRTNTMRAKDEITRYQLREQSE